MLASAFQSAPVYAIYDPAIYDPEAAPRLPFAEVLAGWLRAGVRVVQFRHKQSWQRRQFAECTEAARLARQAGAIFIINDRADVALLAGAHGVHVGQQDLSPADVRKLLPPPAIIGHSTHNLAQVTAALALPIDYLAVGPVFPTSGKANPDPVVGLSLPEQARRRTTLPLVAIGGITGENLASVLAAGADAVAMIGGLVRGCESATQIERRARDLLAAAIQAKASRRAPASS